MLESSGASYLPRSLRRLQTTIAPTAAAAARTTAVTETPSATALLVSFFFFFFVFSSSVSFEGDPLVPDPSLLKATAPPRSPDSRSGRGLWDSTVPLPLLSRGAEVCVPPGEGEPSPPPLADAGVPPCRGPLKPPLPVGLGALRPPFAAGPFAEGVRGVLFLLVVDPGLLPFDLGALGPPLDAVGGLLG